MTTKEDEFDRALHNFRDNVAAASLCIDSAVDQYVNMMHAVETAFVLYYQDMSVAQQAKMKSAFIKLADVATAAWE